MENITGVRFLLVAILIISIFITFALIKKLISFTVDFHWLELICITLFVLSINSMSFTFYSSAYPSLEQTEKHIEYLIANIHFIYMCPLLLIPVLRLFKRKSSVQSRYGWMAIWLIGYPSLLLFDTYLGVFYIKGSVWTPIAVSACYNVITIILSLYFMGKLGSILKREGARL